MSVIYKIGTAALRSLPAERAHTTTVKLLRAGLGPKSPAKNTPDLAVNLGRLSLPNPVGLAAGFDKDCDVPDAMLGAGFGFVECGTVTPRPQIGNPKPRLFRLTEDEAVINRMGFNNRGLDHFDARLSARHGRGGIVGANLGANKDSDDRAADYVTGLTRLWGKSDYFTINISSPNTPGLRKLHRHHLHQHMIACQKCLAFAGSGVSEKIKSKRERHGSDKDIAIGHAKFG